MSLKGETLLRQIAKQTGGRAFFPSREEQLPDVYDTIAADVHSPIPADLHAVAPGARRAIPQNPRRGRRIRSSRSGRATATSRRARRRSGRRSSSAPRRSANNADHARARRPRACSKTTSRRRSSVPGSEGADLDRAGARRQRQHQAGARAAKGRRRGRLSTALRPADPLALVRFSDWVMFEHWLSTARQTSLDAIDAHRGHGRHRAVGRALRFDRRA